MRYVKWTAIALLGLSIFAFLHYNLPQTDIVRIVSTENRRIDSDRNSFFWASPDTGTAAGATRDVFFIQTVRPNGRVMVYRNEDTGWGWPPYFKLNSHNLQARANDLRSSAEAPVWVAVRHYGWRNEFMSIFPNAVSVRTVAGPDVRLIPWINIVLLIGLAVLALLVWRMLAQFRERVIEPWQDRLDESAHRARGRWRRWLGRK